MATFSFELVSPERLLFSGEVDSVVAPGIEGDFTVLEGHAPFMTTLKPGWVEIKRAGRDERLYVRGGFADVAPSGFTILADQALPENEVNGGRLDSDISSAEQAINAAIGDETRRLATEHRDQLREFKATNAR